MPALEAQHIIKSFGDFKALNDVSLQIPKASIFGLLGPNGAGKTTLIRCINQITVPDAGEIFLHGEPLKPAHIAEIGYLPEERGLYPKMKVFEHLLYLARLKNMPSAEAKSKIQQWLEHFQIADWRHKKIEELSKGMAQKIQFIATVLHEPPLLIFDEPFTGFDPINTNLIKEEIRRLRDNGSTVIFSTHRMESVEEICDHIALINKAEVILSGPLSEVKNQYRGDVFRLEVEGEFNEEVPGDFELLKSSTEGSCTTVLLKSGKGNSNQVLEWALPRFRVINFREEVPSLNEIFIQKVEGNG